MMLLADRMTERTQQSRALMKRGLRTLGGISTSDKLFDHQASRLRTAMQDYRYTPIHKDQHQIRLLKFASDAAAETTDAAQIQLSVDYVSLDQSLTYTALSYVWGDPGDQQEILLDGSRFQITRNLHAALEVLQRDATPGSFWADAISINQKDSDEQSWQIQQMGRVFESATSVFFWLGHATTDSNLAMQELQRIGEDAIRAGLLDLLNNETEMRALKERVKKALIAGPSQNVEEGHSLEYVIAQLDALNQVEGKEIQASIASLLDRELWHRAWVFQEFAMANDGYLLCGGCRLSISCFDAAVSAIHECWESLVAIRKSIDQCFSRLESQLISLRGLKVRRSRRQGLKPRLSSLLFYQHNVDVRHFRIAASEPEDIIYSLLGIAGDTQEWTDHEGKHHSPQVMIKCDKKKTPQVSQQAFTQATCAFIKDCAWYRLEYCCFPKDMPSLPTWVPDYQRIAAHGVSLHPISTWNLFRTSGDRKQPPFKEATNPQILLREGCRVDAISLVMEPPQWEYSKAQRHYKVVSQGKWFKDVLNFAALQPERSEDTWRAWVIDAQHERRTTRTFRVNEDWRKQLQSILNDAGEQNKNDGSILALFTHDQSNKSTSPKLQYLIDLFSWAEWINYGRTLFQTKDGRAGLGPVQMKVGDVLVILFGTQVPIVLRPLHGKRFEYVGEAYLHGIMDGEYMSKDTTAETFELV